MEFSGTYLFFAERDQVWQALNDAAVLKTAIPGCDSIDWRSDSTLDLTIKVNLGIMHPKFSGELELSEVDEAIAYTLSGRGHGGILGLAHGSADITLMDHEVRHSDMDFDAFDDWETQLRPQDLATILSFRAKGSGSSQIMALGRSLVGKSAQGIIDRFMGRFSDAMEVPMRPMNELESVGS